MRRLDRPWRRRWIRRILPCHIEFERRIDDPDPEHLRPDQIDGRSRKLRVAGQHARITLPPGLAGLRTLTAEQELGGRIRLVPLDSHHAGGFIVVTGARIVQEKLLSDFERPPDAHLSEKARLTPD